MSSDTRIGIIVLRLRIEHTYSRMRKQRRAFKNIERHVLSRYAVEEAFGVKAGTIFRHDFD